MLFAFEQLIINTEDLENAENEEYGPEDSITQEELIHEEKRQALIAEIDKETDPYLKR